VLPTRSEVLSRAWSNAARREFFNVQEAKQMHSKNVSSSTTAIDRASHKIVARLHSQLVKGRN
jgi:hypothetical protein